MADNILIGKSVLCKGQTRNLWPFNKGLLLIKEIVNGLNLIIKEKNLRNSIIFIMLDYQPSMNKHKKRFKMWEQKIAQRIMPAKEQGNKLLFSIHLWNKVVRKYGSQKN